MDLNETILAEAEDDVPIEQFIARNNARDKGESVTPLPPKPSAAATQQPPTEGAAIAPGAGKPSATSTAAAEPKSSKRHDPQAKIDKAIAAQREAERRAEALAADLERLRGANAPVLPRVVQGASQSNGNSEDPEPTIEQFAKDPDPALAYMRAISAWSGRQGYRDERQKAVAQQQQIASQTRAREMAESVRTKWDAYKKDNPTFEQKIDPRIASELKWYGGPEDVGTPLGNLVADSPITPQLVIYFSEHQDEYQKLNTSHPMLAAFELGQIQERLQNGRKRSTTTTQPISQAKPPVTPPPAAAAREEAVDDDEDMSEDAVNRFIRRGNAQEHGHRNLHRIR